MKKIIVTSILSFVAGFSFMAFIPNKNFEKDYLQQNQICHDPIVLDNSTGTGDVVFVDDKTLKSEMKSFISSYYSENMRGVHPFNRKSNYHSKSVWFDKKFSVDRSIFRHM